MNSFYPLPWALRLWLRRLDCWNLLTQGCMPAHKYCQQFWPAAGRHSNRSTTVRDSFYTINRVLTKKSQMDSKWLWVLWINVKRSPGRVLWKLYAWKYLVKYMCNITCNGNDVRTKTHWKNSWQHMHVVYKLNHIWQYRQVVHICCLKIKAHIIVMLS